MLRTKKKKKQTPSWHTSSLQSRCPSGSVDWSVPTIDLTSDGPIQVKGQRLKRSPFTTKCHTSTTSDRSDPSFGAIDAIDLESKNNATLTPSPYIHPVLITNTPKIDAWRAVKTPKPSNTTSSMAQASSARAPLAYENNLASTITSKVFNSEILRDYQRRVQMAAVQSHLPAVRDPENHSPQFNYLPSALRGPLDTDTYSPRALSLDRFEVETVVGEGEEVEDTNAAFAKEELLLPSQLFDFAGADLGDENIEGHSDHDDSSDSSYFFNESAVYPAKDSQLRHVVAAGPRFTHINTQPHHYDNQEISDECYDLVYRLKHPSVLPSIETNQYYVVPDLPQPSPRSSPLAPRKRTYESDSSESTSVERRKRTQYVPTSLLEESRQRMEARLLHYQALYQSRARSPSGDSATLCGDGYEADEE